MSRGAQKRRCNRRAEKHRQGRSIYITPLFQKGQACRHAGRQAGGQAGGRAGRQACLDVPSDAQGSIDQVGCPPFRCWWSPETQSSAKHDRLPCEMSVRKGARREECVNVLLHVSTQMCVGVWRMENGGWTVCGQGGGHPGPQRLPTTTGTSLTHGKPWRRVGVAGEPGGLDSSNPCQGNLRLDFRIGHHAWCYVNTQGGVSWPQVRDP
jgi:hypothetical protein